jgi:hypothetical protein
MSERTVYGFGALYELVAQSPRLTAAQWRDVATSAKKCKEAYIMHSLQKKNSGIMT